MAILDRVKTDLSSFDYKKIETTRSEPSNVKNLPTPPSRVTEVETIISNDNYIEKEFLLEKIAKEDNQAALCCGPCVGGEVPSTTTKGP